MTCDLNSPIKRHWNIELPIPPIFTKSHCKEINVNTVKKPCTAGNYPQIDYEFLKAKRFELDKLSVVAGKGMGDAGELKYLNDIHSSVSKNDPKYMKKIKNLKSVGRKRDLHHINKPLTLTSNAVTKVRSEDVIYLPQGNDNLIRLAATKRQEHTVDFKLHKKTGLRKEKFSKDFDSLDASPTNEDGDIFDSSSNIQNMGVCEVKDPQFNLKNTLLTAYTPLLEKKVNKLKVIEVNSNAEAILLNYKIPFTEESSKLESDVSKREKRKLLYNHDNDQSPLNADIFIQHSYLSPIEEKKLEISQSESFDELNRLSRLTCVKLIYQEEQDHLSEDKFSKTGVVETSEKSQMQDSNSDKSVRSNLKKYEVIPVEDKDIKNSTFAIMNEQTKERGTLGVNAPTTQFQSFTELDLQPVNIPIKQSTQMNAITEPTQSIVQEPQSISDPPPFEVKPAKLPPVVNHEYDHYFQDSDYLIDKEKFHPKNPIILEERTPKRKDVSRPKIKLRSLEKQARISNKLVGYYHYTPHRFEASASQQKQVQGFCISKDGIKKLENELYDTIENIYAPPPRKAFAHRSRKIVCERKGIDDNNIRKLDNEFEIVTSIRGTTSQNILQSPTRSISMNHVQDITGRPKIEKRIKRDHDGSFESDITCNSSDSFESDASSFDIGLKIMKSSKKPKKKRGDTKTDISEKSLEHTTLQSERFHYIKQRFESFNDVDENLFRTLQARYLNGEMNQHMISALTSLLGEDVNFDDIMSIAPEMRRPINYNVKVGDYADSILLYSMPTPAMAEQVFLPESYQRLVAKAMKLPYKVLVPVGRRKNQKAVNETEEDMEEEHNNPFFKDFETLLERQMNLEADALARLGNLDHDTLARDIARYPWEDLLQLIWNLFVQMRDIFDEIVPDDLVKDLYAQMHDLQLSDEEHILLITQKIQLLDHRPFIYMKAFTGHMKRIVGVCSESIGGPLKLCHGMAHLFGNLLFKAPMPITGDVYIAPKLAIRQIFFWEDEEDEELRRIKEDKQKEEQSRLEKIEAEKLLQEEMARLERLFAAKKVAVQLKLEEQEKVPVSEIENNAKLEVPNTNNVETAADKQNLVHSEQIDENNIIGDTKESFLNVESLNSDFNVIRSKIGPSDNQEGIADSCKELIQSGLKPSLVEASNASNPPKVKKRKNAIVGELLLKKSKEDPETKQDLIDKHNAIVDLFGWNQVGMEDIRQMILEEDLCLNAYENILELILRYWDRIFSSENRQKLDSEPYTESSTNKLDTKQTNTEKQGVIPNTGIVTKSVL